MEGKWKRRKGRKKPFRAEQFELLRLSQAEMQWVRDYRAGINPAPVSPWDKLMQACFPYDTAWWSGSGAAVGGVPARTMWALTVWLLSKFGTNKKVKVQDYEKTHT